MTGLHTGVVIETSAVQLTQSCLGGGTDHSHSYIAQNMQCRSLTPLPQNLFMTLYY